ncbi:MAG: hypothetical protein KBC12_01245 [Candidatus Pacebacteria bacterium]|nr:hypothetical protein [Candidatus Paceibacterota bacterium]MBP9851248.1 hypothetical protein [Candidatus Paceibacterota bacterium]
MQHLLQYFTHGATSKNFQTIGSEVETQFVCENGQPISLETSQNILRYLSQCGWHITQRKNELITSVQDVYGNTFAYELGRQNIEFGSFVSSVNSVVEITLDSLQKLYSVAALFDAYPFFEPILEGKENLLAIPDERDAIWLQLDGKEALMPMARTSSVQFTISVSPTDAIEILNRLGSKTDLFLESYPQDRIWREYIRTSKAEYKSDRYGGPLLFDSLDDYCQQLSGHSVVVGPELVPFDQVTDLNIPLFIRSVWWYFRLKRYGNDLCIEVRPMPRRNDENIQNQLQMVLDIVKI